MPKLFASIESRHGIEDPGYTPPLESPEVEPGDEWGHKLRFWEAVLAIAVPVIGLGMAIWRFGRGDMGPGVADLLLGMVGVFASLLIAGVA
jgi:hypothetical protein